MAVRIPPALIIALVETGLIVLVIFWFFAPAIFGGPEITAAKNIAEMLDEACKEEDSYMKTMFNEVLPDSKGADPPYYLFIAVEQGSLMLVAKRGNNDLGGMVQDFLSCTCSKLTQSSTATRVSSQLFKSAAKLLDCSCKEGTRVLKTIQLKSCWEQDIRVCGNDESGERCDRFQFESHEGHESLTFTVEAFPGTSKVVLSYSRSTVCGDGRCCEDETFESPPPSGKIYCPQDCPADGSGECRTVVEEE
jgi:hypothetical protein